MDQTIVLGSQPKGKLVISFEKKGRMEEGVE